VLLVFRSPRAASARSSFGRHSPGLFAAQEPPFTVSSGLYKRKIADNDFTGAAGGQTNVSGRQSGITPKGTSNPWPAIQWLSIKAPPKIAAQHFHGMGIVRAAGRAHDGGHLPNWDFELSPRQWSGLKSDG